MDEFEKVEKLTQRANVTFEEAKKALTEANGDLLDAMIILEKQGKTAAPEQASYSTQYEEQTQYVSVAKTVDDKNAGKTNRPKKSFGEKMKALWHKLCVNYLIVERNNEQMLKLPIWLFIIILLVAWEGVLIAMLIALFLGCRYSFVGEDDLSKVNDVIDKVSEGADKVKDSFDNL